MPFYDFRCKTHGVFELSFPIATAPEKAPCPDCKAKSPRSFSAPLTASPNGASEGGWIGAAPPGGGKPDLSRLPMTAPMRGMMP